MTEKVEVRGGKKMWEMKVSKEATKALGIKSRLKNMNPSQQHTDLLG